MTTDDEFVAALPKHDLHVHLEGSPPPEALPTPHQALATRSELRGCPGGVTVRQASGEARTRRTGQAGDV